MRLYSAREQLGLSVFHFSYSVHLERSPSSPISRFTDHDIRIPFPVWNFRRYEMAILLCRVISRVEDPSSRNLDQEHACSEDVTRRERREPDRGRRFRISRRREEDFLLKVERLDRVERCQHFFFCEEVLIGSSRSRLDRREILNEL